MVDPGIVDRPRVVMDRRLGWLDWIGLGGGLAPNNSTKLERRRPGGESRGFSEDI